MQSLVPALDLKSSPPAYWLRSDVQLQRGNALSGEPNFRANMSEDSKCIERRPFQDCIYSVAREEAHRKEKS
eukprot:1162136-Pelagomonas_calceolata.AAC.23